jgi:CBS domain-containing protein
MNVRDVMTARPRCAAPDTPLSQVAELMETEDIGAIPILHGDRLVGMITDRDIVFERSPKRRIREGCRVGRFRRASSSRGGPIKIFQTRFT